MFSSRYDGENRLIAMETAQAAVDAGAPRVKLEFTYDYRGRRVRKQLFEWNEQYQTFWHKKTLKYLYDGWRLAAELNWGNFPVRTYTWGLDVSGTPGGAGGIGGLLFITEVGEARTYGVLYDGNGNVMGLADAETGEVQARYEYSPFGVLLARTGRYADVNPIRFSSKYCDTETNLYYFGYRYYNPDTGRWINRDPLGEQGGLNLYGYVKNTPSSGIDPLGLNSQGSCDAKGRFILRGEIMATVGDDVDRRDDPFHSGAEVSWRPRDRKEAAKIGCCCDTVSFIQLAYTYYEPGNWLWKKYFVDPWHVDPKDKLFHADKVWKRQNGMWSTAERGDTPGINPPKYRLVQLFYTCAVCASGQHYGAVYGCVAWGHRFKHTVKTELIEEIGILRYWNYYHGYRYVCNGYGCRSASAVWTPADRGWPRGFSVTTGRYVIFPNGLRGWVPYGPGLSPPSGIWKKEVVPKL